MTEHTSDITELKLEKIADSYRSPNQERIVAIVDDKYRMGGQEYFEETD